MTLSESGNQAGYLFLCQTVSNNSGSVFCVYQYL